MSYIGNRVEGESVCQCSKMQIHQIRWHPQPIMKTFDEIQIWNLVFLLIIMIAIIIFIYRIKFLFYLLSPRLHSKLPNYMYKMILIKSVFVWRKENWVKLEINKSRKEGRKEGRKKRKVSDRQTDRQTDFGSKYWNLWDPRLLWVSCIVLSMVVFAYFVYIESTPH